MSTPLATPRKRKKKKGVRKGAPPPPPSRAPWWIAAALGIALAGITAWAWPPRPAPEPHVTRGNEMYVHRQYRDSLGEYESAPGSGPRNAGVQLDRGLARYRVSVPPGDGGAIPMLPPDASAPAGLTQAQEELRTAARGGTTGTTEDVDALLRAHAAYDLANTLFSQHHWDNAIDAYKEALRLRPGWRDAAWNLELARRLRELERNPPDAGQDAAADVQDASNDAHDSGNDAHDSGADGAMDSGPGDGSSGDGSSADGSHGDGGGDSGARPDSGAEGRDGGDDRHDAGAADAEAPRSMAPLDDLDRTSRSLQNEMLRRRGVVPRSPDDDR